MAESPVLHVFDLPQIYTKPAAEALLKTLSLLTSTPPSWDCSDSEDDEPIAALIGARSRRASQARPVQINPEGLTRYLTNIVGSDLRWIQDEDVKEEIWSQASLRLSERSGRSAMSALSRTFRIPTKSGSVELLIHEPAITADNLGLKTWAASYLLSKRLHKMKLPTSPKILELGSGTGLVGIAAAAVFGVRVVLTDLPDIVSNLSRNAEMNGDILENRGGSARCAILDWTQPSCFKPYPNDQQSDSGANRVDRQFDMRERFEVILAADSLYSPEHPQLLVQTIDTWLSKDNTAIVVVEFPFRDAYLPETEDFRKRMSTIGLSVIDEGEEIGYDDWGIVGKDSSSRTEVRCWWAMWGRNAG